MLERLNKYEENITQIKRENRQQMEGVQKKLNEREKELEDKVQAYIGLSHKYEDVLTQNQAMMKEKSRLDQEFARVRRELEEIIQEKDELEKSNIEK